MDVQHCINSCGREVYGDSPYCAQCATDERGLSALRAAQAAQAQRATCTECGGKYRPAGGPCIHEHPARGHWASGAEGKRDGVAPPADWGAESPRTTVWRECVQCTAMWCALAEEMAPEDLEPVTRAMRRVHDKHRAMEQAAYTATQEEQSE